MRLSQVLGFSALVSTLLFTGCSSFQTTASPSLAQGAAIQGRVHGGRQPIVGAHVYLMAANTSNTSSYGSASVSLLDGNATGQSDSIGAYVLTDAHGGFSISGDYSCTASQQVYLLAVGGDAGAGDNSASSLMAVLGQCPSGSTNFAATVPFISVNEVTTVAGVYALSGYMTDMLHVSSSGTALANIGIANAFVTAANLADISSGGANATTPAGNGTVPQGKINTLANILAACINSDGTVVSTPTPTNCYTLFSNATSDGTVNGTVPAETVTAALNMAHHPGANVSNLFALAPSIAPFQPTVSTMNDMTLAMNFTGGGINFPNGIAVDGYGNVWTANAHSAGGGNSASKFAAGTGAALSPAGTGYAGGNIYQPFAGSIAIDSSNNVWISDGSGSSALANAHLTKLGQDGTPFSTNGYDLGVQWIASPIAIDNLGDVIVSPLDGSAFSVNGITGAVTPLANPHASGFTSMAIEPSGAIWGGYDYSGTGTSFAGVVELDTTGAMVLPAPPFYSYTGPATGLKDAVSMAIDHSGNVWAANGGTYNGNSVTGVAEFSSAGTLLSGIAINPGGANFNYGLGERALAIDGAGHVLIANQIVGPLPNSISELNNDGSVITSSVRYTDGSLNQWGNLAVDGSGNVWVSNSNSLTEFVGLATPVVTPIAAGVANNTLGTQP